jgi:hypothetical protein
LKIVTLILGFIGAPKKHYYLTPTTADTLSRLPSTVFTAPRTKYVPSDT